MRLLSAWLIEPEHAYLDLPFIRASEEWLCGHYHEQALLSGARAWYLDRNRPCEACHISLYMRGSRIHRD